MNRAEMPDVRLVVSDMDGTLLDEESKVPDGIWPLLEEMRARGIVFVPASGRPYATLRHLFDGHADGMPFIAENGTYVVRDGEELSSVALDRGLVREVVATLDEHAEQQRSAGPDRTAAVDNRLGVTEISVVLCGKQQAYVRRAEREFVARVSQYYRSFALVDDFEEVEEEIIKLGIVDPVGAAHNTAPLLARFSDRCRAVVSASFALDVFAVGASKGAALNLLQAKLDVDRSQTMVFGDYHNDLEMIDAADWSFAMANAHPDVQRRARYLAPANIEGGVIKVLEALFDGDFDRFSALTTPAGTAT